MIISAFYNNQIVYAVGMTIIHSIWQFFIITVFLAITLRILRNSPSNVRYIFSVSALMFGTGICLLTFAFHYSHSPSIIQTSSFETSEQIKRIIFFPGTIFSGTVDQVINPSFYQKLNHLLPFINFLYFAGSLIMLIRMLSGIIIINRIKKESVTVISGPLYVSLLSWINRMQIRKIPRLIESASVKIPVLAGYFKPVIILPLSTLMQLPYNQVEAILIHELAHIKRHDYLVNLFQVLAEVLFFYHPLVYWLSSCISKEREHCCDDISLKYLNNNLHYIKALVNIEENRFGQKYPIVAFFGRKKNLLERIKRILNPSHMKTKTSNRIMAGTVVTAGIFILILACSAGINDIRIDKYADKVSLFPDVNFNLIPDTKENDSIINARKATIIILESDEEKHPREFKITLENGDIKQLFINDSIISGSESSCLKDSISSIIKHFNLINGETLANCLDKVKIELEKSRMELDSINSDMFKMQIEIAKKKLKEFDHEKISLEVKKHLDSINQKEIQFEIQKALKEFNEQELKEKIEKGRKQIQRIYSDSVMANIEMSVNRIDHQEIEKAIEKLKSEIENRLKEAEKNY